MRSRHFGWNAAGQSLFGFEERDEAGRNMLWMLFADDRLHGRIVEWHDQAAQIIASFRRDYAQAPQDADMTGLVETLEDQSPLFRELWRRHDVHRVCEGRCSFRVDGISPVAFDHTTLIVDADKHLRLVFYAAMKGRGASERFTARLGLQHLNGCDAFSPRS